MAKKRPANNVFINVPFDPAYEPLFLALIAALVCRGLVPHSVLEIRPSTFRLTRLLGLIEACDLSIHDLSRVTLSKGKKGAFLVPRFNMPFEAGLAVAITRYVPSHECGLLEAQPHRLLQSCSDLNGLDPVIHGGTIKGMLAAVANLFPSFEVIEDPYKVYRELKHFRDESITGNLYEARAFMQLVRLATTTVVAAAGA